MLDDASSGALRAQFPTTCQKCWSAMRFYQISTRECVLLCTTRDCLWPLEEAEAEALCLPVGDPRVRIHGLAAASEEVPGEHTEADVQQEHIQHIQNVLFQETPLSSPMMPKRGPSHAQPAPLPPSTSLGPLARSQEPALLALELGPSAAPDDVDDPG